MAHQEWSEFYVVLCLSQFQLGTSSPRATPGISSKTLPGGSGFDFWQLPGGREFDKDGDFVEIQSETFCPCIGFISNKYRVSQKLLSNGEHYIVDFQFKLRQTPYKCVLRRRFVFPVYWQFFWGILCEGWFWCKDFLRLMNEGRFLEGGRFHFLLSS